MRSPTLKVDGPGIKATREMRGLTQEAVATKIGVDRSAIAHWETSKTQPNAENYRDLCKVLKVKPETLLVVPDDQAA